MACGAVKDALLKACEILGEGEREHYYGCHPGKVKPYSDRCSNPEKSITCKDCWKEWLLEEVLEKPIGR